MSFKLTNASLPDEAQQTVICTADYNGIVTGTVIQIADPRYAVYLEWLAVPNTPEPVQTVAEVTERLRTEKIEGVKDLGMRKIQDIMPAIRDFEELQAIRDWYVALPVGVRNSFTIYQDVADIYIAGRDAVIFLNGATDQQITTYDINIDPSWPA